MSSKSVELVYTPGRHTNGLGCKSANGPRRGSSVDASADFLFDVRGSEAKSPPAGLPWLLYMRNWCKRPIHCWPFDGWEAPEGKSAVAEVYPSLWTRRFSKAGRDGDEQAAYAVAARLQRADRNGSLGSYFNPPLTPEGREIANVGAGLSGSCERGLHQIRVHAQTNRG